MSDDNVYENVRCPELLGPLLKQRVIEITQHDKGHFETTGEAFIELHFENGYTLHLPIGDAGFDIQPPD